MKEHAPRWNGVGYVQVTYEGRTYMSDSVMEATFIIKYMHKDKPGEQMVLKFSYEDDLTEFFDTLKDKASKFRRIPSALYERKENHILYGDNIEKIECRAIKVSKPIEIVRMKPAHDGDEQDETVTVYVRRITPEEMLKYIPSEVIIYNEINNSYKLRSIKGYKERVESIFGTEEIDESIWIDMPGVGRYNTTTGEIEELPQPPTEE